MSGAAQATWPNAVRVLVDCVASSPAPGNSKRLKEIVVSTAAGAHDKPAISETDLKATVKDLRALLNPLRLGDG